MVLMVMRISHGNLGLRIQTRSLYIRALKAEYQISNFTAWHYLKRDRVAWIPHAHLAHPFTIALASRIKWLLPALMPLLLLVVLPAYMLRDIARLRCAKRDLGLAQSMLNNCSIFLGSSISESLEPIACIETVPEIYLHLPWRQHPGKLPKGMACVDLIEVLQKHDIWRAAWETWITTAQICINPKYWHLIAYNYMGLRWHLVRKVLLQIKPREIWISNHYDRWAILVDGLEIPCKTMVQHGDLTMKSAVENRGVIFGPDPKLVSAWRLFHFTKGALEQFSQHVFARPTVGDQAFSMHYEVFSPETDAPILLIIGSPFLWAEQTSDIRFIVQKFGKKISLYYRPHPRTGMHDLPPILDEVGATVELRRLPKSIAIISYLSTLNQALEALDLAPLFVFDYRDEVDTKKLRQSLHQHLSQVLEKRSCAE
jgi:hypothetical protein